MDELRKKLKQRLREKRKKPTFRRQEGWKHLRLKDAWRAPTGRHSKLGQKERSRGRHPSVGFSSPRLVRGLNPKGFEEIRVFSPRDIAKLDAQKQVALIAGSVGAKKRMEILKKAEERNIRVMNR